MTLDNPGRDGVDPKSSDVYRASFDPLASEAVIETSGRFLSSSEGR